MSLKRVVPVILLLAFSQAFSQIGLGTATPSPSTQLDIVSSDKGVLMPRLALTSTTDVTTISGGNVDGLLVYNTSNTGGLVPGYYYWAAGIWNRLVLDKDLNSLGEDVISTNGSITGVANEAALVPMDLEVRVDGVTLEVDAANGVQVKDGGILTGKLSDNAVTTEKINDKAVDGTKIQIADEAQGSMLYKDGANWVHVPAGSPGQVLRMNSAGDKPEWGSAPSDSKRIGEFVFAKSGHGRTLANGYLAVNPGTITNGALDYPIWAAQYPEFVSGNDIVFPTNVRGMFLRNTGGNAGGEGIFQGDATARPNNNFTTNSSGNHRHIFHSSTASEIKPGMHFDSSDRVVQNDDGFDKVETTGYDGNHSHSITGGGDNETRPINRAYQLYTIVDTY